MVNKQEEILECWRQIVFNNNLKSFERFFFLLQGKFMRFCMNYVNNRELAEEIVSDVFTDSWVNRSTLTHIQRPDFYLLSVIKNKSLNQLKKNGHLRIVELDEAENNLTSFYRPDVDFEKKEMMLNLDKAVATLAPQTRQVFKMVKEDGMKCSEVAEILDISVRTVQNHIYRAMNKLNLEMQKYVRDDLGAVIINIASATSIVLFCLFNI
jgi:RNA polymerase sigma-70 factor (family 1)